VSYSKKLIKSLINAAGFDFHRLSPGSNPAFQLLKALNRFEVDMVLDVGANVGQFALELRSVGYKDNIVIKDVNTLLTRRTEYHGFARGRM